LNATGLVSLLPHKTHRVELRLIRRLQESHRRVIAPDKVKLRALVNEKHELGIGPATNRGLLCNFVEVTSRYTKLQNLSFSKTISTSCQICTKGSVFGIFRDSLKEKFQTIINIRNILKTTPTINN